MEDSIYYLRLEIIMDFIRVNKIIYFIEYMLYTCINNKLL